MEKIRVDFETITPIWTGDAWGENSELKVSSIMGSLRFWFEVYCHFSGIEVKEKEELDYNKFIKKRKNIDNIGISDNEILENMNLSLASRIFGCTGWRSRIEIDEISFNQSEKYLYPIGRIEFKTLKYTKKYYNKKEKKEKEITKIPSWFFQKGFYGNGYIVFKTTTDIKDNILLPLLNFIEKYAFIGAKNNIGYGRIKINQPINISQYSFDLNIFNESRTITEENIFNYNQTKLKSNKIQILKIEFNDNDLKKLIKQLLEQKAKLRQSIKDKKQRHLIFGAIERNDGDNNATKIIPLISKNKNSYSGRFLSIVGIKDFGVKQ